MNTLSVFKQTRNIVADSFYQALHPLLKKDKPFSEVDLRNQWLLKLRQHKEIFPDGWYMPPPHGIAVLFGTENNERTSFKSLRLEEFWPNKNIFFNKHGLMTFYASAVSREGVIGDFGATLYLGHNPKIQEHFQKTFQLVQQLFEKLEIGMTFADIYTTAEKLMQKENLYSDLLSLNDPANTNIGHTIISLDKEDITHFQNGSIDWNHAKNILSKKRKFVSPIETTQIKPGMALTLEPRPQAINDPTIPMALFHTVALFNENGEKELVTGFDKIFKLLGLNYML